MRFLTLKPLLLKNRFLFNASLKVKRVVFNSLSRENEATMTWRIVLYYLSSIGHRKTHRNSFDLLLKIYKLKYINSKLIIFF